MPGKRRKNINEFPLMVLIVGRSICIINRTYALVTVLCAYGLGQTFSDLSSVSLAMAVF